MASDASFCLWNSSCHELLSCAHEGGVKVHLECCLVWQGEPVCMKLEGQLNEVHGREAQFFVLRTTVHPTPPKLEPGHGAYYFSVKRQIAEDTTLRLGVHGTASIHETVVGPNGELVYLSVRFSRHVEVRQLRGGRRIPWRDEYDRVSSVLLAPERPVTCEDLRIMLGAYSKNSLPHTHIFDISEGGACVCMPEDLAMPTFTADATYLFFFMPSILPASLPPYVFIAKRAGFGKNYEGDGVPVRLRFQEELDWDAHRIRLRWINIKGGSPRLRKCLLHYPDHLQNPEATQ